MKKSYLLLVLFFSYNLFAQVGIGTTTPHASSSLDISSANSGVLIPRVNLINTYDGTNPINNPSPSLLVYNTNSNTTGGNGQGYYYWDGVKWVNLSTSENSWSTIGNSGTNSSSNFIGTTDDIDLVFKRNNLVAGTIKNTDVSIGVNSKSNGGYGVAIGYNSQSNALNTSFIGNTSVGAETLTVQGFGDNNTAIGMGALRHCATNANTAIGALALSNLTGNNTISGWQNIGIGLNAQVPDNNGNFQMSIGNVIYGADMSSTASGKIGIGVTVPNETLEVAGNTKTNGFIMTNGAANNYVLTSNASGVGTWQPNNASNYWTRNGSNLYPTSLSNNVGINTNTPTSSLNVNGQVTIDQKNFGGYGGLLIKGDAPGNNYPNIAFSTLNDTGNDEIAAYIGGSIINNTTGDETMDLSFLTSSTGQIGLTERMTIKYNGNIGINNNNPTTAKLVISGGSGQEGIDLSSADQYANLRVIRNNLSTFDRDMYLGYGSGLFSSLKLYSNNDETLRVANSNVYIDPTNQNNGSSFFNLLSFGAQGSGEGIGSKRTAGTNQYGLDFYTNGTPKMSVVNNGNVGIATTNPLTKLAVNGEVSSSSANSFRSVFGNYGSFIRNDGNGTYFLLTNSGDQYGNFNSLRPFSLDNSNGNTQLGNNSLFVQHNGNVGVGTTSPAVPLEVRRTTTGAANFRLTGFNESYMEFYPTNTTRYGFFGYSQPNIDKLWIYNHRPGDLAFVTGGNERMTIKNSGAIAISGNEGLAGQVLTSNGPGNPASWSGYGSVIFKALNQTAFASMTSGVYPLAFTSEEIDTGNNFNPATGVFTAPIDGMYHFDYSLIIGIIYTNHPNQATNGYNSVYLEVTNNAGGSGNSRKSYDRFSFRPGAGEIFVSNPSGSTILNLKAGANVRMIYSNECYGAFGSIQMLDNDSVNFTGYLIR